MRHGAHRWEPDGEQIATVYAALDRQRHPRRSKWVRRWRRATWLVRITGRVSRKGWARRRPLLPLYASLAVLFAAVGLRIPDDGRNTATALALVAAAGVWAGGHWLHWSRFTRRWAWVALVLLAAWLHLAVKVGLFGTASPGLWLLLWGGLQFAWWKHHYVGRTDDENPDVDPRLAVWQERVSAPGKALPGSLLHGFADVPKVEGAWEATIQLIPGEGTTADAVSAQRKIASAYDVPARRVVIEPPATDESESRARLLMLRNRNPAADGQLYDATWTTCDNGTVPFVIYPDGERGSVRIWEPGSGPVHGLFSGDSGAGKSRGMTTMITSAAMTGHTFPIVCDPQGGQSLPAWAGIDGQAPWIADVEDDTHREISRVLLAIERAMHARSRVLARWEWEDESGRLRRGLNYYDPLVCVGMPILDLHVDEMHELFSATPRIVPRVEAIAKMARKTGIRLTGATQYPSMEQLGNSATIRQQLAAGNVIAYRNATRFAGTMILPSWAPNPAEIPKVQPNGQHTKGTCLVDAPAPGAGRAIFGRTVYQPNEHHWADIAATHIPALDKVTEDALGDDYAGWRDRRDARERDMLYASPTIEDALPDPTPLVPADSTAGARIVAFLTERGRQATTGTIAGALDLRTGTVSQACARLAERGELVQPKRGAWALPTHDAATEPVAATA